MDILWIMSGEVSHYEYEISYREDFGVWDYHIWDTKNLKYVINGTQVGNPVWAMETIDKWFKDNVWRSDGD